MRVLERLPDQYGPLRDMLIKYRTEELASLNSSHRGEMYIWRALPELKKRTGMDMAELDGRMLELNLRLIRSAPLTYLEEVAHAFSSYWFSASTGLSNFDSRSLQLIWSLIHFALLFLFVTFGFAFPGCAAAVVMSSSRIRTGLSGMEHYLPVFLLPLTIIFYTALVSSMVEVGNPRYRIPTDLLIFFVIITGAHFTVRFRAALKAAAD
jgi:hypothetical protein